MKLFDLKTLTAVPMKSIISWDVMYSLVEAHRYFRGTFCFHLRGQWEATYFTSSRQLPGLLFGPEDGEVHSYEVRGHLQEVSEKQLNNVTTDTKILSTCNRVWVCLKYSELILVL
jgi:hypothetical protein